MEETRVNTEYRLIIDLMGKEDDRLLAREQVSEADLGPMRDEIWLNGLRAGCLGWNRHELTVRVLPGNRSDRGDRLLDFRLKLRQGERMFLQKFPMFSLASVAERAKNRLQSQGALEAQECQFVLRALETDPVEAGSSERKLRNRNGKRAVVARCEKTAEPIWETASLSRHLDNSDLLQSPSLEPKEGDEDEMGPCIFVPPDVWAETHLSARRGGEVESAALWTGRLMKDGESPEIFLVVDACLPAEHAEEEKYSVHFSGDTWSHIEGRLETRRKRLGRPGERFLGSVHGHNFPVPADENGQKRCAVCYEAKVCGRTNALISTDDEQWHRSVFSGQPWATLLIFGWNARDEETGNCTASRTDACSRAHFGYSERSEHKPGKGEKEHAQLELDRSLVRCSGAAHRSIAFGQPASRDACPNALRRHHEWPGRT